MAPNKPGHRFWISTRVAEFFAPGTGARRVEAKLQELYEDCRNTHERNIELETENRRLRQDLLRITGDHNTCLVQDDFNFASGLGPGIRQQKATY